MYSLVYYYNAPPPPPPPPPSLPPHRQPTWFANIKDPSQCAGDSGDSTCTVKFSVCGPLPPNVCGDGNSTGFCQIINSVIPIEHDTGKQSLIVRETSKLCLLVIGKDSDFTQLWEEKEI